MTLGWICVNLSKTPWKKKEYHLCKSLYGKFTFIVTCTKKIKISIGYVKSKI
jgi:hypothetical protein